MKKIIFFTLILTCFTLKIVAQWQQVSGCTEITFGLSVRGDTVFAGTNDGVFLCRYNGFNWVGSQIGFDYHRINAIATTQNKIFVATYSISSMDINVYLSTNNGTNWTSINNGLPIDFNTHYPEIKTFAINNNNVYAGSASNFAKVFWSPNNGSNWTTASNGITVEVKSLLTCGDSVIAGTYGSSGAYFSTNNGANWSALGTGLSSLIVGAISKNGVKIYLGTQNGVYYSPNNGSNWSAINNGLVVTINSISLNNNNIFVGTQNNGFYWSINNGNNWNAWNYGLPANSTIYSLAISGQYIFAATNDGIWVCNLSQITGTTNTEDIFEDSNTSVYPIPVKDYLIIQNENLCNTGMIEIYNMQGGLIKQIYPIQNRCVIDVANISNGLYFLQIKTKDKTIVKKFIKEF